MRVANPTHEEAFMTEPCTFLWNELLTDDQPTAGEFYSQLFGWQRREVDARPLGTYTVFQRDGREVAGMMTPTARDYAGSPRHRQLPDTTLFARAGSPRRLKPPVPSGRY